MKLVHDRPEEVFKLIAAKLPRISPNGFVDAIALGVERNSTLVGGFILSAYTGFDITITLAATSPRWLSKQVLQEIAAFIFEGLRCKRCSAVISRSNVHACDFAHRAGMILEGYRPLGYDGYEDAAIFGMIKNECPWLSRRGKIDTQYSSLS